MKIKLIAFVLFAHQLIKCQLFLVFVHVQQI